MLYRLLLSILLLYIFSSTSFADRRYYVWTYQYASQPKGMTELEFYQTTQIADRNNWEYRLEVEHGLTDNWDFSVYQILKQTEAGPLQWDAVQLRTRYRFGEIGEYILDPLIYLEYRRKLDFSQPNKIEAKFILAKQIEAINLSINPVYEFFFAPGSKHELGIDAALSYGFSPAFSAGVETLNRIEFADQENELSSYFGPTISFASGNWWYSIGTVFGLSDKSDKMRVRFLMGITL